MTLTAEAAAREHGSLVQEIRSHKRAVAYHRHQLRVRKEALRILEEQCRVLGIRLVIAPGGTDNHDGTDPLD